MKEKKIKALEAFWETKQCFDISDVKSLYDIYVDNEISSFEDLVKDHVSFLFYIKYATRGKRFADCQDREFYNYLSIRMLGLREVGSKYFYLYRRNQENFVAQVEALVGWDKESKILEVGGGLVPFSSIVLAKDGYDVVAMEKDLALPQSCLNKLNLRSFRQAFSAKTDISDYSVVVGRRPCSAIRDIVDNCSRTHIPYFIRLCGCEAPGKDVYGWHEELKGIDESIKFYRSYAYNIDNAQFRIGKDLHNIIEMDQDRSMS